METEICSDLDILHSTQQDIMTATAIDHALYQEKYRINKKLFLNFILK